MDDIETILNTLIYDGKVEMTVIAAKEGTVGSVDGQMKLYRGVNTIIQPTGLVKTPCGLCPVTRCAHIYPGPLSGHPNSSRLLSAGVRRLPRGRRDLAIQLHLHERVVGLLKPRHAFLCDGSFTSCSSQT